MEPIQVFISYAQPDVNGCEQLKRSMAMLRRKKKVKFFDQQKDAIGDRESALRNALSISKVVLILLSNDYIADDECYELQAAALEHFKNGNAIVIPILYKECDWDELEDLYRLQPLPRDKKFVNKWDSEAGAFTHLSEEVSKLIKTLRGE